VTVLTTYSQGKVRYDDRVHAVVGVPPTALCDGGLMINRIAGRFDPDDEHSCEACAKVLAAG
jgi:hypothetical protein